MNVCCFFFGYDGQFADRLCSMLGEVRLLICLSRWERHAYITRESRRPN